MKKNIIYIIGFLTFLFISPVVMNKTESHTIKSRLQLIHHSLDSIRTKKSAVLDSFFTARHKMKLFNGAVLFAEYGEIVYENSFGFSDFRKKDSIKINTSFQLASITKPITAVAVLMLFEKGLLSLDDKVKKFFPGFPYEDITVRLLLSHRSGLPEYMYFEENYWPSRHKTMHNDDVLAVMIEHKPPIYYIPDYRYNYCNTNYALLASIIEKVSGMSYSLFMQKRIFEPLEMNNSAVYDRTNSSEIKNGATGYSKRGRRAENSYLNGVVGDKGIYTSIEDMFKFDQALYNGILLNDSTQQLAYQPAHKDLRIWDNYGFGWRIDASEPNKRVLYHSGWWKGFRTYYIRKIDEQKTIIVLTNTEKFNFLSVYRLRKLF
ncbi:MAG: beta-lactamase family protein [Calditrichia bacterium]|nr:beta-lactamase family protein [Calditrichia bacterium]